MELTISKEIKDMIKRWNFQLNLQCVLYGHDYREVDGIDGGKICVCCGRRPIEPV